MQEGSRCKDTKDYGSYQFILRPYVFCLCAVEIHGLPRSGCGTMAAR